MTGVCVTRARAFVVKGQYDDVTFMCTFSRTLSQVVASIRASWKGCELQGGKLIDPRKNQLRTLQQEGANSTFDRFEKIKEKLFIKLSP